MLGDCKSKDCIWQYFPKTLQAAQQHIEYIRSLPKKTRHIELDLDFINSHKG